MVNVESLSPGFPQEIISTDSQGGVATRGFQFRIFEGTLGFYFIGSADGPATATIPTTGDHAFMANEWFHVAVSFDGTDLTFYWTRVANGITNANVIGTAAHSIDLTVGGLLVIGNEARVSGGAPPFGTAIANEGLEGRIDEVRISNIARSADAFIFANPPGAGNPEITSLTRLSADLGLTITWTSVPEAVYTLEFSPDLESWNEISDGVDSEGTSTSFDDDFFFPIFTSKGFYRVSQN